jgi:branched-chain amino acid aminotransferase
MKAFWLNGKIVDSADAKVSVLDHGLLYGDGIFEGIRSTDGYVVDLDRHLERLTTSARAVHLALPDIPHLRDAVLQTLSALGEPDAYVRLLVTRGEGELGIDVASCKKPNVFCIAGMLRLYAPIGDGVRLVTSSFRRPAPDALDPRVKSLNYLNNVLCRMEAKRHGADEALVLNARGTVAEASGANVFVRLNGEVLTPPTSDGALAGITRGRVLRLLGAANVPCREAVLTRYDLLAAEEVFLSGTGAGIVPVSELDGQPLGQQRNTTSALARMLVSYASQHGTPVPALLEAAARKAALQPALQG